MNRPEVLFAEVERCESHGKLVADSTFVGPLCLEGISPTGFSVFLFNGTTKALICACEGNTNFWYAEPNGFFDFLADVRPQPGCDSCFMPGPQLQKKAACQRAFVP